MLYLKSMFSIEPNSSPVLFEASSGVFPESFKNYVVVNIGRTTIRAIVKYGTVFGWIGNADEVTIAPGERKTTDNGNRPYYRMGLEISNTSNVRAMVSAVYTDGTYPGGNDSDINIDYNNLMKKLVVFGVKFVPYAGPTISALLAAFWPEKKENIWEQIRDKVQDLIDKAVLETINSILSGDIRHFQERIKVLGSQLGPNSLDKKNNVRDYYMNLAQDLVGFEFKFTSPENEYIAFSILPLYSAVVMMKMNYYAVGIAKAEELGLTDDDVRDLKNFSTQLLQGEKGVITYLKGMYKERLDGIYASGDARIIYDSMMNTRSFIAVNGLEYVPLWESILEDASTTTAYVNVITYSEFHGRSSPNLYKESTPELQTVPLTPSLINGKRDKLTAVELHIWRIDNGTGPPKIGGLKVFFESGNSYMMGGSSSETNYVDFQGANLNKLRVVGANALDMFTFYFSDGREETYGTDSDTATVFELKDHHIASMILANDSVSLAGQAANVAVSYIQNF